MKDPTRYRAEEALRRFCSQENLRLWMEAEEVELATGDDSGYHVPGLLRKYPYGQTVSAEDFRNDHLEPELYKKLRSEELVATYSTRLGAERREIPAEHWHFLRIDFRKNEAFLEEAVSTNRQVTGKTRTRTNVHKFLLIHEPVTGSSNRDGSNHTMKPTIRAEKDCEQWILSEAESTRVWKKQEMFGRATRQFPGLSRRAFERAWTSAAPAKWKRPGRKSPR